MSSHAEPSARPDRATVCVEHGVRGRWKVVAPGRAGPITCDTLEAAERAAYLSVARTDAREVIVRDAYHRVLHHELIAASRPAAVSSGPPAPASTQSTKPGGH